LIVVGAIIGLMGVIGWATEPLEEPHHDEGHEELQTADTTDEAGEVIADD